MDTLAHGPSLVSTTFKHSSSGIRLAAGSRQHSDCAIDGAGSGRGGCRSKGTGSRALSLERPVFQMHQYVSGFKTAAIRRFPLRLIRFLSRAVPTTEIAGLPAFDSEAWSGSTDGGCTHKLRFAEGLRHAPGSAECTGAGNSCSSPPMEDSSTSAIGVEPAGFAVLYNRSEHLPSQVPGDLYRLSLRAPVEREHQRAQSWHGREFV